jgi:hypothetical protein
MIDGLLVALMEHSGSESDDGLQYGQVDPQKTGQMGNVGVTRGDS